MALLSPGYPEITSMEERDPVSRERRSSPSQRRVWLLFALFLAIFTAGPGAQSAEPVSREFQLKAAFLYNFTKFIEWPPRNFPSPNSPIVIAVLGRNVFGAELEKAVQGRTVNGRGIVVKTIQTIEGARNAQMVFVSASEDERLEELKETCRSSGVLTVGETETFARRGGGIAFKLEGDKLRFDINIEAAEQAGLKVSAQLQKLAATIVRK